MVADKLQALLTSAPQTSEVSLAEQQISDLESLLPMLAQFPNLRSLRLSNNELTSLPADLSCLVTLELLDIKNNPITQASNIINGLASLPSLKHLFIDLPGMHN